MKEYGKKIEDQLVDICETALDTVTKVAGALKLRLATRRVQRQKQSESEEKEGGK